ncbi:MAG: ATP-binding protein [Ignavibacteriae bacterium HGW-Ignavibacteriae-3]|nr:MAG: ATP-binding protein [Ignavibacteriae bacterium HGW-Ignavibacteriae-3]
MKSRRRILDLIEQGEGLNVEFKQRFSSHEKIAKELIAFANTSGGIIFFGVDDDKSIYGIDSEKSVLYLVHEAAEKFCEPPIVVTTDNFEIENKELLIVEVPESKNKPHRIQDYKKDLDLNSCQVYVRINDKSVLASKEMIKLLQTQTAGKSLEKYVVGSMEKIVFNLLDKNETISVKELSKLANISDRRASRTLIKLVRANLLLIHQKDNGESYFTYAGR